MKHTAIDEAERKKRIEEVLSFVNGFHQQRGRFPEAKELKASADEPADRELTYELDGDQTC